MLRPKKPVIIGASLVACAAIAAATPTLSNLAGAANGPAPAAATTTPIKHLVVIFQENVSFDHYFGTYPNAANTSGEPFEAKPHTPAVDGLTNALLTSNPNGVNPRRYDPTNVNDVLTCDQDHGYSDEQKAFDNGAMDKFVSSVGNGTGKTPEGGNCVAGDVMNYYDGNTVTALWNYAQGFSMSDNFFSSTFGPSSPGAINIVSGDTGGVGLQRDNPAGDIVSDGTGGNSLISDAQPYYDDCSTRDAVSMTGQNIGDLLNAKGISWGWFQGGFKPTTTFAAATGGAQPTSTFVGDQFKGKFATKPASDQGLCNAVHPVGVAVGGTGANYGYKDDYIPHHEPFQYYASTANPHHLPPASVAAIGTDTQTITAGVPQFDTANHQYDISDFDALVAAINHGELSADHLPAVSFLKAPGYQDGHAGYSDPLDEQQFVTNEINALESSPAWSSTAVIITYDDSDGWYDHAFSGVQNPSNTVDDFLTGTGMCGAGAPLASEQGRCGLGPRMPFLVISPFAKHNYVDHTLTNFGSVVKFVEDNWGLPRISGSLDATSGSLDNLFSFDRHEGEAGTLYLNPTTGQPFLNRD